MTEEPKCANCLFFLAGRTKAVVFEETGGMCRRYAPQGPTVAPLSCSWQSFPPMSPDAWCGDYRPTNPPVENISRVAA